MSAPTTTTPQDMPSPKRSNSGSNSVKKALSSLKRRGSKLLSRRASTPGTMSTALVHSPSRSPSSSLRSRSRSPSPTPAGKSRPTSMHVRARTTSFGFSLTRGLRKNSSSSGVNDSGPSSHAPHGNNAPGPNKLRKPSSLRSLRSDATTAVDSLTASATSTDFPPSPLVFKDSPAVFKDPSSPGATGKDLKLSLDMSRASESGKEPLSTIYSAMPQTDDEEEGEVKRTDPFLAEPLPEEQEPEATVEVVETPEPIAEDVPVPMVAVEAEKEEVEEAVPEEPVVAAEAEVSLAPEPEVVAAPAPQELAVPPTPSAFSLGTASIPSTPITPAPAPLSARPASPTTTASSEEEEEFPEVPALVLPTMFLPIPNVRTLLSTVMGAPFFTLHWWLHPLLPIV